MKGIGKITTVVTPIDFSENAQLIADSAAYVAASFKASLTLIFVVQNLEDYSGFFVPQMNLPELEHDLLANAQDKMSQFCDDNQAAYKELGMMALDSKVLVGDVAEQIVDYAAGREGCLIVMGTHGYKGLERIMFGSVANKVIKIAPCPVMSINPYTCCGECKEKS